MRSSPADLASAGVMVTGAGGFAGRYLMETLALHGASPSASPLRLPDRAGFARLLRAVRPQAVVHLAARTFLPTAADDPAGAVETNVEGTRSVLEALRDADPDAGVRLVFVSSSYVYRVDAGGPPGGPTGSPTTSPLDEDAPLDPASVYGRTKLAAELMCRIWCESARTRPLIVLRPFNHTGPGQKPSFAAPRFARQTALIEAGKAEPVLHTGDLSFRRDFCDVRDVVRAYARAALGAVPPGTYNLARGTSVALAELAEFFRSRSKVPFEIRQHIDPQRASEARELCGRAARIHEACGWSPEIPLEKTLTDLLDEWRTRIAAGEVGEPDAVAAVQPETR